VLCLGAGHGRVDVRSLLYFSIWVDFYSAVQWEGDVYNEFLLSIPYPRTNLAFGSVVSKGV
jgi:hypothetical protein